MPVTLKTTSEIFFLLTLRLLYKILASEQPSAWILHPAVKKNVLTNARKLAWIVTKSSPEIDGTHDFGYKAATSQSQHLSKTVFPIEWCFLSQMDFNLLPFAALITALPQYMKHLPQCLEQQDLDRDSQFPPPTTTTTKLRKHRVISTHLMFLKMQFIKAIAHWLAGRVSATTCASCQPPPGLSQTGIISTLVQLHELAPDHIICKSIGIISHGHTFVETWTFPFGFSAAVQLTDFSHYKHSLTKHLFRIKIQKWMTDKCISHYVPLSAAAFHPAHT